MLFSYTYIEHTMEKMQGYIDFIFYDVWCVAKGNDYEINKLFAGNVELKDIITELDTSEVKGAEFFLMGLQQVFEDFKLLSVVEIDQLKHWYDSNNNIELCCAGDSSVTPVTYADISTLSKDLSKHLKSFYKNLYSQSFLSLKSIKNRIGEIDGHYQNFMDKNDEGKCPFCGIHDIKGNYHTKREAYDHYLPKDKYPFNTINFSNLVPACNECNSSYKLSKNTLFESTNPLSTTVGTRRKAFYPYSTNKNDIKFGITLSTQDWTNIIPDEIHFEMLPELLHEEIATWNDVYAIEERYKAKCCGKNDGKGWIIQIIDESENCKLSPEDYLSIKLQTAENSPLVDVNFLKKPFLEACQVAGIFNVKK